MPSYVLLSLLSEKALLSLQEKHDNLLAKRSWLAEKIAALPLATRNDDASFKGSEIVQMQECTMDSRLRGNDSSHKEGLKLFENSL